MTYAPNDLIVGHNQYGKAQVRMVCVDRSGPEQSFVDLNVGITLSGDLEAVHRSGDNAHVIPTDTQKNTVFAFAREAPVGAIEDFALRLGRHFVASFEPISRARVSIDSWAWRRIEVDGIPHPHSFMSAGSEARTAEIVVDSDLGTWVTSGLKDLIVLKTTGSEFSGYIKDRYTTLAETDERILSTSVNARWRHASETAPAGGWDTAFTLGRTQLLERFAAHHSLSLQQTLFEMGAGLLDAVDGSVEVRMSMPNRHHFVVDLQPFGLDNPNQVFRFEDRPYGLIEAQLLVPDAPPAGPAWDPYPLV